MTTPIPRTEAIRLAQRFCPGSPIPEEPKAYNSGRIQDTIQDDIVNAMIPNEWMETMTIARMVKRHITTTRENLGELRKQGRVQHSQTRRGQFNHGVDQWRKA